MQTGEQNTRQLILDAALEAFHKNGFKGARTTQIAARAGISRTMLHYYFNTKEALFEAVLHKTFGAILPHLNHFLREEDDIFKLLEHLVTALADMLEENPGLPSFVVNILNENPELIFNLGAYQDENTPGMLDKVLEKASAKGLIRPGLRGEDLVINIWAMCSTPYLLAPYIAHKEKRDPEAMRHFIRARRSSVLETLVNGIKMP